MRLIALFVVVFAHATWQAAPCSADDRCVAFIAAVSEYPGNAALYESMDNADKLAISLNQFGFEVTTCLDFTRSEFESAFENFCADAEDAAVALVYINGHGGSIQRENYLFPLGADVSRVSEMPSRCIGLRATLAELADNRGQQQRLNVLIVDGSRSNPFMSRAREFEEGSADQSAFYSLPYLPRNTIVIQPTGSGELLEADQGTLLVDALCSELFVENLSLRKGLKSVEKVIKEKSSGKLDPSINIEFGGDLTFAKKKTSVSFPDTEQSEPDGLVKLRNEAKQLADKGEFDSAVAALLEVYDQSPDDAEKIKSDIRSILSSSSIENPFVGKSLIESEKFKLERLASDSPVDGNEGLDLKEARRIYWFSGQWFVQHREQGKRWATLDAESGDPEAMVVLARIYLKSNSPEDDKTAADWIEKASEKEYQNGIIWMGTLHFLGRGLEKSLDEAAKHYQKAWDLGDPRGVEGHGHVELRKQLALPENERNFSKVLKYYTEAINNGTYAPAANLAQLHLSGLPGTEINPLECFQILMQGAEEGADSRSMWVLFDQLDRGRDTTFVEEKEALALVSEEKQYELLKISADLGFPAAVSYAQANGIDFLSAAKPLCEEWGVSYEFWKFRQREKYASLREQN